MRRPSPPFERKPSRMTPVMRVGIDASLLLKPRSGIGRYIEHLIQGLDAVDGRNDYVLFAGSIRKRLPVPAYSSLRVSCKQMTMPTSVLHLLSGFGKWRLPTFDRIASGMDVIHWPNYLLIESDRSRAVVSIHDLTILLYPQYHPWTRVKRFQSGLAHSAKKADAIIVPSHSTKTDVVRLLDAPEHKIHVVNYSAAPSFVPANLNQQEIVLRKYGLSPGRYVAFLGNLEPRKNLDRLLESFARLVNEGRRDCPLVLIGAEGWKSRGLIQSVERLSLQRYVTMTGYVSEQDLPALLSGAVAFVYPSLYEGFGLPPLEAMACGTPVITSNVSSLPEVVGDAAILVDPYDTEALSSAMLKLISDTDLRHVLREKGLARAKLFSWDETARQTLRVYEQVCGRS
jgi:glycosyltransferase involved in cell wall biosynthesis